MLKYESMINFSLRLLLTIFALLIAFPSVSFGKELEVSGWIPYWKVPEGTKDARDHLDVIDVLHPFGYTIKSDGKLNDLAGVTKTKWRRLFKEAKKEKVKVVPTITTSNGVLVHEILSDPKKRAAHIKEIVKLVSKRKFDGININYEGKQHATREYFSLFLKELKTALKGKELSCAVESRTPLDSLYKVIPDNIEYLNDYDAIGRVCDRVEIMTYDQQRADIKLNDLKGGLPYMPVSDADWVRKVAELAVKHIPREKIMLGVPTYGVEWEVTVAPNWFKSYKRLWSLNPRYGWEQAEAYGITPSRTSSGEMGFTYVATTSPFFDINYVNLDRVVPEGDEAALKSLQYVARTGGNVLVNYVTWSDAPAIMSKVQIAKELGLAGIAIFKIDGGEDQNLWDLLK